MLTTLTVSVLLGLAIGSFLNVVVLRGERGERVTGRSRCMHCGHALSWYELIPLVSYLLQRGKCRSCAVRLSLQYPLVEFATGVVFVLVAWSFFSPFGSPSPLFSVDTAPSFFPFPALSPFPLSALFSLFPLILSFALFSLLIAITVYDLRTKLIPDSLSYSFAGLACAALLVSFMSPLSVFSGTAFLAGPALFFPFFFLWDISDGRWIGLGDAKLALGIGWLLGLAQGFTAIMFAFWIGAGVSLSLMALQRVLRRVAPSFLPGALSLKTEIPFGPFLVLGTAIVYFTGANLFAMVW